MKVLIIGTGSVGSVTARYLLGKGSIRSLTLADKDLSRVEAISNDSKKEKVQVAELDADDEESLEEVIAGNDIVLNTSHPKYNDVIMEICLRLGVNYVDNANKNIMGQLSQDKKWWEAGLLAVVGLGEDPGLSNIYARYGADKLDFVDEIKIRDGEYSKSKSGRANVMVPLFSPRVFYEEITTPGLVFAGGKLSKVPMLSGREEYQFPQPINTQTVYSLDHEEVETLPHYIGKGVSYVDFKLALGDEFVRILNTLKDTGMLRTEPIKVSGDIQVSPFDLFLSTIPNPMSVADDISGYAGLVVEIRGRHDGRSVAYVLSTVMSHEEAYGRCFANATSFLTGIVPAVFIAGLAEGKFDQKGVIPPEGLDAETMLQLLSKAGVGTTVKKIEEETLGPENGPSQGRMNAAR